MKDGISDLHYAITETYDLIILDVMLPKLDGWTIMTEIRKIINLVCNLITYVQIQASKYLNELGQIDT